MASKNGIESITARDLHRFLTQQGCTFTRQVGSHLTGKTPAGNIVRIPDPGSNHPVTTLIAKGVGHAYGLNLRDFRRWVGYDDGAGSTQTSKRAATSRPTRHKAPDGPVEYVDQLAESIRDEASMIFRSGLCRGASMAQRRELRAISLRLKQWRLNTESGAA